MPSTAFLISFIIIFSSRICFLKNNVNLSIKFLILVLYCFPDFIGLYFFEVHLSFLKLLFWILYQAVHISSFLGGHSLGDYCALLLVLHILGLSYFLLPYTDVCAFEERERHPSLCRLALFGKVLWLSDHSKILGRLFGMIHRRDCCWSSLEVHLGAWAHKVEPETWIHWTHLLVGSTERMCLQPVFVKPGSIEAALVVWVLSLSLQGLARYWDWLGTWGPLGWVWHLSPWEWPWALDLLRGTWTLGPWELVCLPRPPRLQLGLLKHGARGAGLVGETAGTHLGLSKPRACVHRCCRHRAWGQGCQPGAGSNPRTL